MENQEKAQLIDQLKQAIQESGLTQNKFATARLNISSAMLSQVLNNWQSARLVGENTWNTIKKLLAREGYKGIPTENFQKVCTACQQAYDHKAFIPVVGEGGYGKTFAMEWFKKRQEANRGFKVYYFDGSKAFTRKQFVVGLMRAVECYSEGTIADQIEVVREHLEGKDCVILCDEVSKLKDHNVVIIKDIMTALKGVCGIVFAGTPYFINNINKGANKNKHLFSETRDRLFMITYSLQAPTDPEAEQIFQVNGLQGEALDIVMGRVKNTDLKKYYWRSKPTFRGISDSLTAIRIASSDVNITYPSIIE